MTISSRNTVEVFFNNGVLRRKNDPGQAPRRSQGRHRGSLTDASGRPIEPALAKRTELEKQVPAVQVALVVRRAKSDFWCEGQVGDWGGRCGHCVLAGEGYVQTGERRLCLACADIEAKQVVAAEKAFARALFEGVKEALADPVGDNWNFRISAGTSPIGEACIRKKVDQPENIRTMSAAAQALSSEKDQLAKLARSQESLTRILEEERQHRERPAGENLRGVPPNEPIDEEMAHLVDGIAQEVAIIGALCDTLRSRLDVVVDKSVGQRVRLAGDQQ